MTPPSKMAAELFDAVEASQGRAYISDGVIGDDAEVLRVARCSLLHTEKTAALLRKFIAKHAKRIEGKVR